MEFSDIKKLADDGVAWACGLVGDSYCNGKHGLVPSQVQGLKYLTIAADSGRPLACYRVGEMYYEGLGCEKDESKAEHYFLEALKQGHEDSALPLVLMYQKRRLYSKALYYYSLYIAYGGELDHESFDFLNQQTKPAVAEKIHADAEAFQQAHPKPNEIEMLGYSGVFIQYELTGGVVSSLAIAQEEPFLQQGVEAAHEFIKTYREQNGF
jgi:hypothetical protein